MSRLDLTQEEYDEAVDAYTEEFRTGQLTETTFLIRLIRIGMDKFEAEYLIRTNRP